MPPRSRFVVTLAVVLCTALPIIGMWFLDMHLAAIWLGGVTLLLVLGLLWDLVLTWRRHRAWAQEYMCPACRAVFTPNSIIFEGFDSGHFPVSHQAL